MVNITGDGAFASGRPAVIEIPVNLTPHHRGSLPGRTSDKGLRIPIHITFYAALR